tara:strand:+ start:3723 stop:3959 length:237 start_codon:yes stop_codon:yes gene_type:complete
MPVDTGELTLVKNTNKRMGANSEYLFTILEEKGEEAEYMFTPAELEKARYRATRNIEDWQPKRSVFSRIFRAMKKKKK